MFRLPTGAHQLTLPAVRRAGDIAAAGIFISSLGHIAVLALVFLGVARHGKIQSPLIFRHKHRGQIEGEGVLRQIVKLGSPFQSRFHLTADKGIGFGTAGRNLQMDTFEPGTEFFCCLEGILAGIGDADGGLALIIAAQGEKLFLIQPQPQNP